VGADRVRHQYAVAEESVHIPGGSRRVLAERGGVGVHVAAPGVIDALALRDAWTVVPDVHFLQEAVGTQPDVQQGAEFRRVLGGCDVLRHHEHCPAERPLDASERHALFIDPQVGMLIAAKEHALLPHGAGQRVEVVRVDLQVLVQHSDLATPLSVDLPRQEQRLRSGLLGRLAAEVERDQDALPPVSECRPGSARGAQLSAELGHGQHVRHGRGEAVSFPGHHAAVAGRDHDGGCLDRNVHGVAAFQPGAKGAHMPFKPGQSGAGIGRNAGTARRLRGKVSLVFV